MRGGLLGLDVFVFIGAVQMSRGQRQETKVMGTKFKMEGGRSKMEIQRAVYLQHGNQLDCQSHAATVCGAHSPLPHITLGQGVQHVLRCIVGPVVVRT